MTLLPVLGVMLAVMPDLKAVTYPLGGTALVILLPATIFDLWMPPKR